VADAITSSDFYNLTILQAGKDIGDLLSHPGEIPGAIASVAPGLGPIAELPQAVSGALGVIRAIGTVGAGATDDLSNPNADTTVPQLPDQNKLNHIFGNPDHNLDPVVQQFGGQSAAYNAIEQAAINGLGSGTGTYTTVVEVGGANVTVTGAYVNGVPRIGTAFIP